MSFSIFTLLIISLQLVQAEAKNHYGPYHGSYSTSEKLPRFLTEGRHVKVVQNNTLTLPCNVANIGSHVRAWKRGIAILTAGNVKLSPDERLSLVHGYDLEIRHIRPEDEGDYVCQIATLQPQEITHTVEVLVPPTIMELSGGGTVEVRKGTPVTLECRAKGNPPPFYQWTRRTNTTLPGLKPMNGSSLSMGPVTRHQAGMYQCIANNGVGYPAVRELTLRVLYSPEVEADEPWVHSGIGNQAVLTCTVYAEPEAQVRWYRSTLKLDVTDDHVTETRGNRHRLIIRQVQLQDLDNYTCEAHNYLGKARQNILLTGKPHVAIFRSPSVSKWRDSYNISWSVFSYTPLEEHKLYYRQRQFRGQLHNSLQPERWGNLTFLHLREWNEVSLPSSPNSDITQEMSYLIRKLDSDTQYEAKVQARNSFGWNKMSEVFTFSTRGLDGYSWEPSQDIFHAPETDIVRDMGVTALGRGVIKLPSPVFVLILAGILNVYT